MNKAGRLSFDYEPRWRDSPGAYRYRSDCAASITYSTTWVSPYLWNLLRRINILQRWGQQFHVPRNPFKLLKILVRRARAAQFFPPRTRYHSIATTAVDRLDQLMSSRNGSRNCDPMWPRCGAQASWQNGLPGVQAKTGSTG